MDDLPFLRTFLQVYTLGSVTRAAAALHRTQPTVTYQLRRLEEALGKPLFVRHASRLTPTPLAVRLHALARGFARDLEVLARDEDAPRANLEVASVSAFGRHVLFPLLRRSEFARDHLTVRFPAQDEAVRAVLEARVDVGFLYRAPVDARLEAVPVYQESLELVANPAWARRLRRPSDAQDLPLVTYDDGEYVVGRWFGHHFGRRAPRWASVAHFEEIEEVVASVADGRGVAIVPGFCARIPAARGRVRPVRWGRPPLANTVFAARRRGVPAHPRVERLIEALRALASPST